MDWLKVFRSSTPVPSSAQMAKDRLMVAVAYQRHGNSAGPSYLPRLREEILDVVRRYVPVSDSSVNLTVTRMEELEVLEMNIALPEGQGPGN